MAFAIRAVAALPVRSVGPARRSALRARSARPGPAPRALTTAAATPVDVAQVAGIAAEIGGVAGVMCAITLVGLAIGFVLLRVESAVEGGE